MGDFYDQDARFIPDFACKDIHFYPNDNSYRMFFLSIILFRFLSAFLTQSLYDIFRLDNSKGVWNRYLRNHDVIKADGLVAFDARKVNMSPMMEFMPAFFQFASAQAIFLFARAIINMVKDVFFCEQGQCTIDRRFIHIRYLRQNVRKRKGSLHGFMQGLEHKQAIRCHTNACLF